MMRSTNHFGNEQTREIGNESVISKPMDSNYASDPTYIAQFEQIQNPQILASGPPEPHIVQSRHTNYAKRDPYEYSDELREFFKAKIVKAYNIYRDSMRYGDPNYLNSQNLSAAEHLILKKIIKEMKRTKSKRGHFSSSNGKDKIKIKLNANKIMKEFMSEKNNHNLPLEQLFGEESRHIFDQKYKKV